MDLANKEVLIPAQDTENDRVVFSSLSVNEKRVLEVYSPIT